MTVKKKIGIINALSINKADFSPFLNIQPIAADTQTVKPS